VQIDYQAVILAKDLVESVMQRIGAAEYTILGTVKGAELELLRFTHPFMGFDVPAILGDHVTLDAGTGAVHTAAGHGPDDYVISKNTVWKWRTRWPGRRYWRNLPELDGVKRFKANDKIVALLSEKARCCTLRRCSTATHAAGVTSHRSSSGDPAVVRQHGSERPARAVAERDQCTVDP
jgi:isoleucyl-tRNA synthetase